VEDLDDTQQKDESTVNHGVEQAVQNQNQDQMMLELANFPNKSSRKKVVMMDSMLLLLNLSTIF